MKHGLRYKVFPNADGRFRALGTDGIENGGAFDGAADYIPVDSSIEVERMLLFRLVTSGRYVVHRSAESQIHKWLGLSPMQV